MMLWMLDVSKSKIIHMLPQQLVTNISVIISLKQSTQWSKDSFFWKRTMKGRAKKSELSFTNWISLHLDQWTTYSLDLKTTFSLTNLSCWASWLDSTELNLSAIDWPGLSGMNYQTGLFRMSLDEAEYTEISRQDFVNGEK